MITEIEYKPAKISSTHHDSVYEDMLRLREENYTLKSQLEKITNFWEYGKIDQVKIANLEDQLQAEKEILVNAVATLNMENEKLKQQFEYHIDDEMQQFAQDIADGEWTGNTKHYGNYINVMILDNKAKTETIKLLKTQLSACKLQLSSDEMAAFNLPQPGSEFTNMDRMAKEIAYSMCLRQLNIYKQEFELMCQSMNASKKDYEDSAAREKEKNRLDMQAIKGYCERLKGKSEYYTLYEAAKKRVEDYKTEIVSISEYGEEEGMRYEKKFQEGEHQVNLLREEVRRLKEEKGNAFREVRDKELKIGELGFKLQNQV
jgi:hypothetical protein